MNEMQESQAFDFQQEIMVFSAIIHLLDGFILRYEYLKHGFHEDP